VRDWTVKLRGFETVLPVLWQKRNPRTPTSDIIWNARYLVHTLRPKQVILFGYNYSTYIVVMMMRALFRRRTHLFCETTLSDRTLKGWKRALKTFLFRVAFDQFIVPGKRSAEYLMAHGVAQENIFFARNASPMCPASTQELEKTPGLRLLFVGRLAPEKRIVEFTRAFAQLGTNHRLSIVGDGPDAGEVSEIAESHPGIELLGAMEPDHLPEIYARHDALVLVSESEPWGLVVNEAVNFGLALLLSPQVGSAPELLDGNGVSLEEITVDLLGRALKELEDNLTTFRTQSLRIAAASTPARQAAGILAVATGAEIDEC